MNSCNRISFLARMGKLSIFCLCLQLCVLLQICTASVTNVKYTVVLDKGLPGEELAGMKNVSIKTGTTTERMECASACATDKTGCSGFHISSGFCYFLTDVTQPAVFTDTPGSKIFLGSILSIL
ncbi:uncharacterized protein LOC111712648 [Eurytemora carolleeae]|uniref:uncharacterized protein LOC111712648 n=1 Tax=Eurytemora carolleeae TaxID=1294199 RepID=UPI000C77D8AF|nr:uncharacterized protein LOC111712648 [Eurytemora carolleeae]|eukprot:XP_023343096.1 uncharacterized protein LOC111712648 [Eurytemora affinis]